MASTSNARNAISSWHFSYSRTRPATRDQGGLEDYARLMYPTIVEANVPTWIIGVPTGREPLPERPAPTMKIWPEREPVRMLTPVEFNVIIDALAKAHCDHR